MPTSHKEDVRKVKVAVHLFSAEVIWGYLYLQAGERIQDLMNDDRLFIPLLKINTHTTCMGNHSYPTVVINKQSISRLEER